MPVKKKTKTAAAAKKSATTKTAPATAKAAKKILTKKSTATKTAKTIKAAKKDGAKKQVAISTTHKPYAVPRFLVPDTHGNAITNKNLLGKWSVVYFYPKDMTSGCTVEAGDFEKAQKKFATMGAQIIGVSKDSCARHLKFAEKENLSFMLLSDEHSKMCETFGVWGEKSLYGRKYMGIERATFLVDPKGNVVATWRKVKVPGHVDEVLKTLQSFIN